MIYNYGKKDISTSISNSNNTITKPDIYNLNGRND